MSENILEQQKFTIEAKYVIENMDQDQLIAILKDSFTKSLKVTFTSKKDALKNLASFVLRVGKNTGELLKNEIQYIRWYKEEYIKNLFPRIRDTSIDLKDNVIQIVNEKVNIFKSLSLGEKKDIILSGILWAGTILVVGGGTDFEGGVPDLDIKTGGIGRHRNIFSHTILVGLALEFFLRLTINLLRHGREYLPSDRSTVWRYIDEASNILDRNENVLISGMWLGLSIHLLKDANLGSSNVKPYVGMPTKLSMETHQNIFTGNSFLSFLFGTD